MTQERLDCLLSELWREITDCQKAMKEMRNTTEQTLKELDDGGEAWFHHLEIAMEIEGSLDRQLSIVEKIR